jgi:hypothetical protein
MTHMIEAPAKSSLHTLRAVLEQAERQVLQLGGSNIEAFFVLLDQIEQIFADFGQGNAAVLAEGGRWASLVNRISSQPKMLVDAAAHAGGLPKLRSKHPPATGSRLHVDAELTHRRTQTLKRVGLIGGTIIVLVALALWGMNNFTPAEAEAGATTTMNIEQLAGDQQWQAALAVVEKARQTLPNEPELLVWEGVLAEQVDDAARAQTSLAQAQQMLTNQPVDFWLLVGNDRQQVGNLAGAEEAAQRALAISPQDAQVTFLLGGIAEAHGDIVQAADYFSQTIALAGEANAELAVTARVRMGYLTQRVDPLPGAAPAPTPTPTAAPQS